MDISPVKLVTGGALALIVGAAIGRFSLPTKVITKTEVKTEIKEVVKWKTTKQKQENRNKEIIIVETKLPDGTVKKEKRILDRGVVRVDSTQTGEKDTSAKQEANTVQITQRDVSNWRVGGLLSPGQLDGILSPQWSYGARVDRRIAGPFSLGVWGLSNKYIGIGLGLDL